MAEPDGVDGRHKAGHDGGGSSTVIAIRAKNRALPVGRVSVAVRVGDPCWSGQGRPPNEAPTANQAFGPIALPNRLDVLD
jgi:hypothetical protein